MASEKKAFSTDGLDLDSEEKLIQGYGYALNVNIGTSDDKNRGAVENSKGNRLVSVDLPGGTNTVIGVFDDKVGGSVIYFVFNSALQNRIYRFFINTEEVTEVARGQYLNFDKNFLINSIALDGDLLVWTDGNDYQKKINLQKSYINNLLQVKLYVEYSPDIVTKYTLKIDLPSGANIINNVVFTVPSVPYTLDQLTTGITAGINALAQSPGNFIAVDHGAYVALEMTIAGYYDVEFTSNGATKAMAVYNNTYQLPYLASYTDYLKAPPRFPPIATFVNDASFKEQSQIEKNVFEFRTRYIYDDGEISTLSPASKLAVNQGTGQFPFRDNNEYYINVDYSDEKLTSSRELNIITGIDLFVRLGNEGPWKKVRTISISEMFGSNAVFQFFNNEEYEVIADNDANKNFDALPLLSDAIEIMNNYTFLDAKLEGYDTVPTDVGMSLTVNNDLGTASVQRGSFFHRPAFVKYGLVYFDRGNRSNTVSREPVMDLQIPGYTDDLDLLDYVEAGTPSVRQGTVEVNWEVRHLPPVWATHWAWVRTLDSMHNDYFQSTIKGGVQYKKSDKTDTTFGSADASFIEIKFTGWIEFNDFYPEGNMGWSFSQGDKMRILKGNSDVWVSNVFITDIAEQIDDTTFLIVNTTEMNDSAFALGNEWLVEFYTPGKAVENDLYYEIGEFYEVISPHTDFRYHAGNSQNQNPLDPINTPAKGVITNGDNYRITAKDFGTPETSSKVTSTGLGRTIDSPRASQEFAQLLDSYDVGRINVYAPEAGQEFRGNSVRFSRKRFPGTGINGFSSFDGGSIYDRMSKDFGNIKFLKRIDNILLCLCEREAVSLYIEEALLTDNAGNSQVTKSTSVIGNHRVLFGGYGTENPESFVRHKSRGYWFSSTMGEYVRYGGDGLTSLSANFASSYFKKKGQLIRKYGGRVFSTFDQFHDKLIVAFQEITEPLPPDVPGQPSPGDSVIAVAETISYDDYSKKRWTSFWSYLPDQLGMADTKIVSFKNGQLWIHDSDIRNNFYGVQYTSQIEAIMNQTLDTVKVYQAIGINGSKLWVPIQILTPEGQKSSLIAEDFELREGKWYSAILCDENTPNVNNPITQGDAMRSTILRVMLENADTEQAVLVLIDVESVQSSLNL